MSGFKPAGMIVVLTIGLLTAAPVTAENIDPDGDGSRYAYAENVGWINAEPTGNGGDGIQVGDLELTGWMWGENIGWVNLNCTNTGSCAATNFGVTNDGCGNLNGHAWAENVGWINFSPATAGVRIDPQTGDLSGHAWGENVGWIAFASDGPNPFKVKTAWRRDPPTDGPEINLAKSGSDLVISWNAVTGADGFDVIEGSLVGLRSSSGDFATSPSACLADGQDITSHTQPLALGSAGDYYLVRAVNCGGSGTADSVGTGQIEGRDVELGASGNGCP